MPYSMTGFGKGGSVCGERLITVEIRSVNHRYCEISVKSPREFGFIDDQVRSRVKESVSRGKIDVGIRQEQAAADDCGGYQSSAVRIDETAACGYIQACKKLSEEFGLKYDISVSDILRMPEVVYIEKEGSDDNEVNACVMNALDEALELLNEFRSAEGGKLSENIREKLAEMKGILACIEARAGILPSAYMDILAGRIKEYLKTDVVDEQRLAQEVAIYADRCCIDEEIVRLKGHIEHLGMEIQKNERIGRKLDFITQEINREINTIGSKAGDLDITTRVVEMKSILEQIREQVQNIE